MHNVNYYELKFIILTSNHSFGNLAVSETSDGDLKIHYSNILELSEFALLLSYNWYNVTDKLGAK